MSRADGSSSSGNSPRVSGRFRQRLNRFVVELALDDTGEITTASLPNPGRLAEILLPDVRLGLKPGPEGGRHPWRVVSADLPFSPGESVYLDTGGTNRVARDLLEDTRIPELADYRVVRAEVRLPGTRSRTDFLLESERDGHRRYLEVKSCTLFNGPFAMFPDAVTDRGRRHVEELSRNGSGAILFVVHSDRCEFFVPDYHTDPAFSNSLEKAANTMPLVPVGVRLKYDGSVGEVRPKIPIPWETVRPHMRDGGYYIVILHFAGKDDRNEPENPANRVVPVGALGNVEFTPGWYVYVGSALRGLDARIRRHRRKRRKRKHWHIDYLREVCRWEEAFPIRSATPGREEPIARDLARIAGHSIPGFGSSDSDAESHLFFFDHDPRRSLPFIELILRERRRDLEEALLY